MITSYVMEFTAEELDMLLRVLRWFQSRMRLPTGQKAAILDTLISNLTALKEGVAP